MTTVTVNAPVPPAPLLLRQPKEPSTLCGWLLEYPKSWLEMFDRVAVFKAWTDDYKLKQVYFALEDAVRTSFES